MLPAPLRDSLALALAGEGALRFDEPMARHTTLRIGGRADAFIAPSSVAALQRVRAACAELGLPCQAVGGGSNLLVLDGGVRGALLSTDGLRGLSFGPASAAARAAAPEELRGRAEGARVEAGVTTGKLLSEATRRGLGALEFLGGVPGSVGGGLVMNAGTYLGEWKDVAVLVDSIDARGALVRRSHAQCGFVYRGSALPRDEVIVAAELLLPQRERAQIEQAVRALRDRRREREPHGFPNAGSIFKNPPGDHAGRLIEACGLKGQRVGDAEIARAHANWILNVGQARAADVLTLVAQVRAAVQERFGVVLELEVKTMGEELG